jgi:SAM-dependent methyltransferase
LQIIGGAKERAYILIVNENIDNGRAFDFGCVSSDYAKYRDIYPSEFYERIIKLGLCVKGQRVLDLGTGTGVLPRNLYPYGAEFIGADISENQIEQARLLSQNAGMNITYTLASAETFDFPNESFDVVTACQCFQYFDKAVALPRIHKVLKKNGHFCILFMAWLPAESKIANHTEELVLKYNPEWNGKGLKRDTPSATPVWAAELFVADNIEGFDVNIAFTRESWHGRIKTCRGIGASSLSDEEKVAFDKEHWKYMQTLPETFDILHFVTILNLRAK